MKKLYLVIPCYNEEEVINETAKQLVSKLKCLMDKDKIDPESKIVFVDDGSKDRTWEMICELNNDNECIRGIKLSRNKGHQNALLAGLLTVKEEADMVISLDADLQDDINAIDEMVDKYHEGCDIVYGVRSQRDKDSLFKKYTAQGFYKFIKMLGVEIVYNHADYRLMSRRALDALEEHKEVNLFLRGMIPLIGFKTDVVTYERSERFAGESKYPLKKMLAFALEGITSFSIKPIRIITAIGSLIFTISLVFLCYFLVSHFRGYTVKGWTSTIVSVWALGGFQLLAIGMIGEYIGKMYLETKARPKFFVDKYLK
jgi:glycosyltransferase involved in cell wall biosynthesis